MARFSRRKAAPVRSHVRLAVDPLEGRLAPALLTPLAPQFFSQLNENGFVGSGDFNKDGNLDLVVANYGDGTAGGAGQSVVTLNGDGKGGFVLGGNWKIGDATSGVNYAAVGDLTGDGNLDIVTANIDFQASAGTLSVLKGSDIGTFGTAAIQSSGGFRCYWVGIADLNGDGKQDVLAVNGRNTGGGDSTLVAFKGDGAGGLTQFGTPITVPLAQGVPLSGALADFDGDGKVDLAVSMSNVPPDDQTPQIPGSVFVYRGNGDGTFDSANANEYPAGVFPVNITAGDLTGDGKPEIVVANAGDPDNNGGFLQFGKNTSVTVLRNDGSGFFAAGPTLTAGLKSAWSVSIADMNLDGKADITATNFGNALGLPLGGPAPGAVVYLQNATGAFGFAADPNSPFPSGSDGAQFAAVGNFNSTAASPGPDVVVVHSSQSGDTRVAVFRNDTVTLASPTVDVTSDNNPADFGESVTFTAAVSGTAGVPTGKVQFFDGATQVGPDQTLDGTGKASVTVPNMAAGAYTITAKYAGDTAYAAGSDAVNQTVNAAGTGITLVSDTASAAQGAQVKFTATVSSGAAGTITGSVQFFLNGSGTAFGSNPLTNNGGVFEASLSTTALPVGANTITAKYVGAGNYAASPLSGGANVTITGAGNAATSGNLVSSGPSVFAQPVTFTVTVSSGGGTPTGTVQFFTGATQLGTDQTLAAGKASVTVSSLAVGNTDVVAKYLGTAGFDPSTSNTASQSVSAQTPTIGVQPSSNPATFGPITLTATVAVPQFGSPAGSVTFFDNGVQLGNPVPLVGAGTSLTAQLTTSAIGVGSRSITAQYGGTTGFNANTSAPVTLTVNAVQSTVTVQANPSPATFTQDVTLTALVTPASGTATGTVNFFDGGVQIGSGQLNGTQATFVATNLSPGPHTITAKYAGTTGYAPADSAALSVLVNSVQPVALLTASQSPSLFGSPVTFTATVTGPLGVPTGTVELYDGGTLLGQSQLASVGGLQRATFTVSTLQVGDRPLTAKYLGTTGYLPAGSTVLTQTVTPLATTITLTSGSNPVSFGAALPLTATVAATGPTPAGTVTFFDGTTALGTAPLANGVATFNAQLGAGSRTLSAKFAANGGFAGSESTGVVQTITPAAVTLALSASGTPTFGAPATFTAVVSSTAGSPGGTVSFFDGTNLLGTAPVATVNGQQVATFTTSALPVGGRTVSASLPAGGNFATANGSSAVQVAQAATTVSLTPGTVAANVGEPVTFTAAVGSSSFAAARPGGTVTFLRGNTTLGTVAVAADGKASLTTSTLAVGEAAVTARYDGDANYATATSAASTTKVNVGPVPTLTGFREFAVGAGAGGSGVARFFNPDGSPRFDINLFPGFTGGVRVTSADFNGDGVADMVAGSGPGSASRVFVIDGVTKTQLFSVDPFEATFTGGVYVTTGDLNNDGKPELVITPDEGGGPRVDVYSGNGFGKLASFFGIDDPNFRGGARAAVSDVSGDGVGDLIVAAGFGGGPRVAGFSGTSIGGTPSRVFPDFFAFEETLRNGVFIAAGDLDADGKAEVIAGGGPGGGPRVTAFDGAQLGGGGFKAVANFFAGNTDNRGGVRLVARNLDNDNRADLVVGDGSGAGSRVTGYVGASLLGTSAPPATFSFDAYSGFTGGVYVG